MADQKKNPGQRALRRGRFSQVHARYFITICSYDRTPILTRSGIPEILFEVLMSLSDDFDLIASVVMSDHLHFVIRIGESNLTAAIKRFKGRSAIQINRHLDRSGTVWQNGYYDHKFRGDDDLAPILCYLWNNPKPPGKGFRCNREDWLWFKSLVTEHLDYPVWLREHPMG